MIKLKFDRINRGYSQRHVSEATGIPQCYISDLETKKTCANQEQVLKALAKFFKVPSRMAWTLTKEIPSAFDVEARTAAANKREAEVLAEFADQEDSLTIRSAKAPENLEVPAPPDYNALVRKARGLE